MKYSDIDRDALWSSFELHDNPFIPLNLLKSGIGVRLEHYVRDVPKLVAFMLDQPVTVQSMAHATATVQYKWGHYPTSIGELVAASGLVSGDFSAQTFDFTVGMLIGAFTLISDGSDDPWPLFGATEDEVLAYWYTRLSEGNKAKLDAGTLTVGEFLADAPDVVALGVWQPHDS